MSAMKGSETRRKWRAAGIALAFLILCVLACSLLGAPILRLVSDPESFRRWVDGHGFWGRLAYMGMVILQICAAFIPGEPLEIAGGFAFGAVEGTLLCLAASAIGSGAVILLVRRFGRRLAELFFSKEKLDSLGFLQSSPKRLLLFSIIFIIPGTPKDLLCYFAGLTDIKLSLLLLICSVGRIPSVISSTLGGDALGTRSYLYAVIVFLAALALSAAGLFMYRKLCKKEEKMAEKIKSLPPAEEKNSA